MKKVILAFLTVAMLFSLFSCSLKNPGVTNAFLDENGEIVVELSDGTRKIYQTEPREEEKKFDHIDIDENYHAFAVYSDGTREDLGFVGVSEKGEKYYEVVFLDIDGNELKKEAVESGKQAEAPDAPEIEKKVFERWDTDFSNVQSNLVVKPVYRDAKLFLVTFLDINGDVFGTTQTYENQPADYPEIPEVEGKVFDHFDKNIFCINEDLTTQAVYRDKNTFTITYKDYSGRLLGTEKVTEGENGKSAVDVSKREGYTFTGWSQPITKVYKDITVTAQYRLQDIMNAIDISYELLSSSSVKVTYSVKGNVEFAGCDLEIKIPSNLKYKSLEAGTGTMANKSGDSILISAASPTNYTSDVKLATAMFDFSGNEATFDVVVSEFFRVVTNPGEEATQMNASYKVLGSKMLLK